MNYKQIGLASLGFIALLFIKQILFICGTVWAFKFIKENLLFASDRDKFIDQYFGSSKSVVETEFKE